MELRYKDVARVGLESFVNNYEEAFRELYSDTGLWNESDIIDGYHTIAKKLYDDIAGAINKRLTGSKVIGRKLL